MQSYINILNYPPVLLIIYNENMYFLCNTILCFHISLSGSIVCGYYYKFVGLSKKLYFCIVSHCCEFSGICSITDFCLSYKYCSMCGQSYAISAIYLYNMFVRSVTVRCVSIRLFYFKDEMYEKIQSYTGDFI